MYPPAFEAIGEDHSFAATYALANGILQQRPEVTAIIGTTDIAAVAAIHAVRDLGTRGAGRLCSVEWLR